MIFKNMVNKFLFGMIFENTSWAIKKLKVVQRFVVPTNLQFKRSHRIRSSQGKIPTYIKICDGFFFIFRKTEFGECQNFWTSLENHGVYLKGSKNMINIIAFFDNIKMLRPYKI